MKRFLWTILLLVACAEPEPEPVDIETLPAPPLHTPRWAFEPWISKDISDAEDTRAFVAGFEARDIPVGVVVLDSPWETSYNTFVPSPDRYPEFPSLLNELRQKNIRLVLWVTPLVNEASFDLEPGGDEYDGPAPNYHSGKVANYYVNNGATYFWWKGVGAAVDFFNPDARRWWHQQQDALLDLGIGGWKLDFGESYINTATISTAAGIVTHQQYSEEYYHDFFRYGANRLGTDKFVTMVRAYDESYQFPGRFFARPEHAPIAWMGDNRRDWQGLSDALDHLFRSARAGYVVLGSDIGGYLDRDDKDLREMVPFNVINFARWVGVGAMTPFMQLHGRANLAPWTVPERSEEFVSLYRDWSKLHSALVPFFYSLAERAHRGEAPPIIRPIGEPEEWPGDYRYQLGDAFLVAPILDDRGVREVRLPSGAQWFDWWSNEELDGGTTITSSFAADLSKIPLFVREGAIIPLKGETILIYPGRTPSDFKLYRDTPSMITQRSDASSVVVTFEGAARIQIRLDAPPAEVTLDGAVIQGSFDLARKRFEIEVPERDGPRELQLRR